MPGVVRTVLVAEDDDDDFFLLSRAFSRSGTDVELRRMRDGAETIEYLLSGPGQDSGQLWLPPDLLLLDLKMPRLGGFEVLRWLKEQRHYIGLPVVVLSSSNEQRDIQKAYELGANSYLVKPYSFAELPDLISTLKEYWFKWNQSIALAAPMAASQMNADDGFLTSQRAS